MRTTFCDETVNDWAQRYENCLGLAYLPRGPKVVRLVSNDSEYAIFTESDGHNAARQHVALNSNIEFEFPLLRKGFWKSGDKVMYSVRRPRRQWRRGINEANSLLYTLTEADGFAQESPTIASISGYLFNEQGHPNIISNEFAVDNAGRVYFYNTLIGYANKKAKLFLVSPNIQEELADACRASSLYDDYKVVNYV